MPRRGGRPEDGQSPLFHVKHKNDSLPRRVSAPECRERKAHYRFTVRVPLEPVIYSLFHVKQSSTTPASAMTEHGESHEPPLTTLRGKLARRYRLESATQHIKKEHRG